MLGNHDKFADLKQYTKGLSESDEELFYYKDFGSFRQIFLDSSSSIIGLRQLEWLRNVLISDNKIIIFIHHPIISVLTPADESFALQFREELFILLESYNQEINIFCGHYHMDDFCQRSYSKQFVSPSGSFQLLKNCNTITLDNSIFGYRIISLNYDTITTELRLFSAVENKEANKF